MAGIDPEREFLSLRIAILTISDTRTIETDTSGGILVERAERDGHQVVARQIVIDDQSEIEARLRDLAADEGVDVVITTGGTGLTKRDVTPEAVIAVCDKLIPGFGEVFRAISRETIGLSTLQSRALGGVCSGTPIFALPGSNGACRDAWDGVLHHQLDARYRPCNIAELLPRM